MPVYVNGIPKFEIQPPLTSGDKGLPSPSIAADADRLFNLIQDERHLTALALYKDIQQRIDTWDEVHKDDADNKATSKRKRNRGFGFKHKKEDAAQAAAREKNDKEVTEIKALLRLKEKDMDILENRCRLFVKAQQNLNVDDDWTLASTHFGIKTYYRREEEDGSLSLKMEGEIKDVPLFEQVCVLKEVDLHYKWAPFCSSSLTIADIDKLDTVGWFMIGLSHFGIARDGCFRAIGCDNIQEDGSILLAGQGLQDRMPNDTSPAEDTFLTHDPVVDKLEIPPVPSRRGSGRMTIRRFEALIHVTSPTSAKTRIVANINPNIAFMPQSLLEFIMKHVAGVVLGKLQTASRKIAKNPLNNAHAVKMREERQFYEGWLMKKFQYICQMNGWEMPVVSAFNLTSEQMKKGSARSGARRLQTFGPDHSHSVSANVSMSNSSDGLGDGSMSELTNSSARTWMSNPIGTYLRDVEERTRQRKAEVVAETRQIASDRLKPQNLSVRKQERLEELKLAQARRIRAKNPSILKTSSTSASALPVEKLSVSQRITAGLNSHGKPTRFVIVSILVSILFTLLHPDRLLQFSPVHFDPEGSWGRLVLEGIGAVAYISLCSVAHFALCDVALVYAFDALEIGEKAGRQAKRYYGDNVRLIVVLISAGILGFSVLKAALRVWVRASLWYSFQVIHLLKDRLWSSDLISTASSRMPGFVGGTWNTTVSLVYTATGHVSNAVGYVSILPVNMTLTRILDSNFLGRAVRGLLGGCIDFASAAWSDGMGFVDDTVENFEGKSSLVSWRTEAFGTARSLFSYTAVFLLTVLVLFNLQAKQRRHVKRSNTSTVSDIADGSSSGAPILNTAVSSLSDGDGELSVRKSHRVHVAIPEDEVVFHDVNGVEEPFVPDVPNEGVSVASSKRRRARFRFRRTKTQSSGAEANVKKSDGSVERPRFRKTKSV